MMQQDCFTKNYGEKERFLSKDDDELFPDENSSSVKVAVRIRPHPSGYGNDNDSCILTSLQSCDSPHTIVSTESDFSDSVQTNSTSSTTGYQTIHFKDECNTRNFTFDHVLPQRSKQIELYSTCVAPLVRSCLEGYNATIFAYGQTGSGKTHTIIGDLHHSEERENDNDGGSDSTSGVIPRALRDIFDGLNNKQDSQSTKESSRQQYKKDDTKRRSSNKLPFEFQIKVQFLELYGDDIYDLLVIDRKNTRRISIRDGKPGEDAEVMGISQIEVKSAEEALLYLNTGMKIRRTDKTAMNAVSSRSHVIFTVLIQQTQRKASEKVGANDRRELVEMKTSKIHIVDLAGSERVKKAKTKGRRLQEGININKGLFVLGNVISALGNRAKLNNAYVPYRDSKLTRLLKGSLGGNHKTLMIACVSPCNSNKDESRNTLRYANRAKNIKNHAKVNIDPSSRVMNELHAQVTALAKELLRIQSTSSFYDNECPFSPEFLENLIHESKWKACKISSHSRRTSSLRPSTAPISTSPHHLGTSLKRSKSFDILEDSINMNADNESVEKSSGLLEDEQIALYDDMRTALRQGLKVVKNSTPKRINWNGDDLNLNDFKSARMFEKSDLDSHTESKSEEDSYEYINNPSDYLTHKTEETSLHDTSCTTPFEVVKLVKSISEDTTEIETTSSGVGTFLSVDNYSEYQSSTNESLASEKEYVVCKHESYNTSIMGEYVEGYQTLRVQNEVNLIETKIENLTKEKEYLDSINSQQKETSFYSTEIAKSVKEAEDKIFLLQKERESLLALSKITFDKDLALNGKKEIESNRRNTVVEAGIVDTETTDKIVVESSFAKSKGTSLSSSLSLVTYCRRSYFKKSDSFTARNLRSAILRYTSFVIRPFAPFLSKKKRSKVTSRRRCVS